MSLLDTITSGSAFQNPTKLLLGDIPTDLRQLKEAISLGQPAYILRGIPLDLTPLLGTIGGQSPEQEQFTDSFDALADSYDNVIDHTDQQTSTDTNPNSNSPNITQILSLNGAQGDASCQNVVALCGLLLRAPELFEQFMFWLNGLQAAIDSLDQDHIENAKLALDNAVEQEKEQFRTGVQEVQKKAQVYVLQSAFGDKCAGQILDAIGTEQLKLDQKIYEETQRIDLDF